MKSNKELKYYSVNRIHPGSIVEEILRLEIVAEDAAAAREELHKKGYIDDEIILIDDDFWKIKVCFREDLPGAVA